LFRGSAPAGGPDLAGSTSRAVGPAPLCPLCPLAVAGGAGLAVSAYPGIHL